MGRRKKDFICPHLNNSKGDMNADWYIEFSIRNKDSGKMERKRIYDGFKDIKDYEERMRYAHRLIEEYTNKIMSGEISGEKMIEFENQLLYDTNILKSRKKIARENTYLPLVSEFLTYKMSEVSEKSLQSYKSKLRAFYLFLQEQNLEERDISAIQNYHVITFLKDLFLTKKLSRLSIEKYGQMLHAFFYWVINLKKIRMENPALNLPRIGKVVDESAVSIPLKVRSKLQKKIEHQDPQLWIACCIQYYTAIRPKEMRMIQLKDIDLEARTITVRNFLAKNSRTETIDIPEQLYRSLLLMNLENYDSEDYILGKEGVPGPTPLGKNALRLRFNKYRDELGLSEEIKFYSWKHTGASELKKSGANMYDIQRHFRHKNIATTERYWRKRLGGIQDDIKNNFPDI